MKIRFYSIKDLYDEVKDFSVPGLPFLILRMQFLTRTYSQQYGLKDRISVNEAEQILTLSVARGEELFYYSQPYWRCSVYDFENKADEIEERTTKLEKEVRETFKDWTIKKGVYESPPKLG